MKQEHIVHFKINKEQFVFKAFKPGEEYLIDVLEDYEDSHTRDRHAESLYKTFL